MERDFKGRTAKRSVRVLDTANRLPVTSAASAPTLAQEVRPDGRRERWLNWLRYNGPFIGVIVLAAMLRFIGLGDRPLHHDESLHAYFSLQLLHNLERWQDCLGKITCYHYDPLLHGPFQFHAIALVYKISQLVGVPDHGVTTTTVRIVAAVLGTLLVALPYSLRDYLGGRLNAWLACFLLAVSPGMVYFSRFAREDIYMACFTLLLVVAGGRYIRDRKGYWLVLAAAGFALAYATKEATFLLMAVFGSYLALLVCWELGGRIPWPPVWRFRLYSGRRPVRYFPQTAAPVLLLSCLLLAMPLVRWLFSFMKELSISITNDPRTADLYVQELKDQTQSALPWIGAVILLWVGAMLVCDVLVARRPALRQRLDMSSRVDAKREPLLTALLTTSWVHWFLALEVAICIFVLLFSVVFTNLHHGLGDGIWQGLYYWLQQQQVARGGQPWFYYFLLIPLYEQIGVVFALVGIVRCLRHLTRFRFFLIYWLVGNVALYSWAGEKMPWLMIHMALPMLLLAAIGLEPLVRRYDALIHLFRKTAANDMSVAQRARLVLRVSGKRASTTTLLATATTLFLLVLTLQNMFQVTFVHYADGPHEMMIYVQTTKDVDTMMGKIARLDQLRHQGRHTISIGVMSDAGWPFYWYLRDYTNVCYGFPGNCTTSNPEVIIGAGDDILKTQQQYAGSTRDPGDGRYAFHRYHLRSWWDEGYKPPPCVPTATVSCQGQPTWGGIGLWLWLSYGRTPPSGQATYQPFLALRNVWNWWWLRIPIGGPGGSTDVGLMIRSDLSTLVQP